MAKAIFPELTASVSRTVEKRRNLEWALALRRLARKLAARKAQSPHATEWHEIFLGF
jgi:hypothetical protein